MGHNIIHYKIKKTLPSTSFVLKLSTIVCGLILKDSTKYISDVNKKKFEGECSIFFMFATSYHPSFRTPQNVKLATRYWKSYIAS